MIRSNQVQWRHTWATGCTPRIAVFNCSESVGTTVRIFKAMTLSFQLFLAFAVVKNLCRNREQVRDSRGWLQIVVLGFCCLGGLHSLSLVAEVPNDVSQQGLLFLVEYLYSLFNGLMIGAMGLLNCVWLEVFHKAAFPKAEALRETNVTRTRRATLLLLVLTIVTSVGTDTALVASPSSETYGMVVHVQHYVNAAICTFAVPSTIVMMRRSVQLAGPKADSISSSRLLTTQWIIAFLWVFCISFCMFCAVGGQLTSATNVDPETAILFAWISHASFVFTAGGVIGSFALIMVDKPALLDYISWLFKPPCCCLALPDPCTAAASEQIEEGAIGKVELAESQTPQTPRTPQSPQTPQTPQSLGLSRSRHMLSC